MAPFPIPESLVFSPDDRMLAIGASWYVNGLIQFRNVSSGAPIRDVIVNNRKRNFYTNGMTAVVFSTSKNEFAVAAKGYVALYRFPDSP